MCITRYILCLAIGGSAIFSEEGNMRKEFRALQVEGGK
jgi:hypothetical protein